MLLLCNALHALVCMAPVLYCSPFGVVEHCFTSSVEPAIQHPAMGVVDAHTTIKFLQDMFLASCTKQNYHCPNTKA